MCFKFRYYFHNKKFDIQDIIKFVYINYLSTKYLFTFVRVALNYCWNEMRSRVHRVAEFSRFDGCSIERVVIAPIKLL